MSASGGKGEWDVRIPMNMLSQNPNFLNKLIMLARAGLGQTNGADMLRPAHHNRPDSEPLHLTQETEGEGWSLLRDVIGPAQCRYGK